MSTRPQARHLDILIDTHAGDAAAHAHGPLGPQHGTRRHGSKHCTTAAGFVQSAVTAAAHNGTDPRLTPTPRQQNTIISRMEVGVVWINRVKEFGDEWMA